MLFERVVGAFELRRVVDRARRARLAAEAAVHALGDVDVETAQHHLPRVFVLHRVDDDAVDRTRALAGETPGADLEVDLEDAA